MAVLVLVVLMAHAGIARAVAWPLPPSEPEDTLELGPVQMAPAPGGGFSPPVLAAGKAPRVSAGAAVLMDWETGEVLYAKNAFQRRAPASTTKVLTALIALERAPDLSQVVTVSRRAAGTPGSSMHIRTGERYTLHDLLFGLLLRSGNDAAVAIAEHLAGSVEAFADLMNRRAAALGAKSSHFMNPHGLDHPMHYTTAYDLTLISRVAMANPRFAAIAGTRERQLTYELLGRSTVLNNTNRLLWSFNGADGGKTGTTGLAGACLFASASRTGQRLLAVVLHAGNRWNDAAGLLEYGFREYQSLRYAGAGEVIAQAPIAGGLRRRVPLVVAQSITAVLPRGADPRLSLALPERLRAPVKEGQQIGELVLSVDGRPRQRYPLLAARAVPKPTPWQLAVHGSLWLTRQLAPWGVLR